MTFGCMINLRRKRDTALRRYLRARANIPHSEMTTKLEKEYEVLRNDFNTREWRNLGLLPQQREELHGIEPDALNLHFA